MRLAAKVSQLVVGSLLLSGGLALGLPVGASAAGSSGTGAVSLTKTVTRVHLNADGTDDPVDSRTVTLQVSQTTSLRSRQPIQVTWSGAHPTSGVVSDPNSPEARQQEYPFVLVECRGVDSTTVPLADQIRPETCWTGTSRERVLQDRTTGFGPWRLDRYETPANREASVGVPNPFPAACDPSFAKGERWLHFVSVTGIDYAADGSGCPSVPPESQVVTSASQPANTTYAATGTDGTGSTKFTVWTSEDNASLGCGGGVQCALVAIPIEGISCDPTASSLPPADQPPAGKTETAAAATCEAGGSYAPGAPAIGGTPNIAVEGALWFSASNWRNRLTVPLNFAPLNNVCDIVGGKSNVDVYGSELATQLTTQWRPAFCLSKTKTPFKHVQIGEPQAANLLTSGGVDAAFLSNAPPGGFTTPTVQAPISETGFAISYAIDDANGNRYTKLRLTPRLLAKLLTESYPGITPVQDEDAALAHNPLDITLDPEFIALNPGITKGVPASAAASTLLTLSSDSDVVEDMTKYIEADPEARDWLNGVPDPWGMVVNPAYSTDPLIKNHLTLPVDNWPLRDTFEPQKYYASGNNICLQNDPVPILPLIAAPTARLADITLAIQFASSSSQLVCQTIADKGATGAKLVAQGRQTPGFRFVMGVTSLGDAHRYDLDTAALQTYVDPSAYGAFTSDTGRTFVTPDDASLAAAAKLLTPDDSTGTWTYPYAAAATTPADAKAYPGAMLLTLAVPTTGVDHATALGLSQLLTFAAGPGQTPGLDVGQVPPGFLPLTAADNLKGEQAYTAKAASLVLAQKGGTLAPSGAGAATASPAPTVTAAVPTPEASATVGPISGAAPLPSVSAPAIAKPVTPPAPTLAGPVSPVASVVHGVTAAVRSAVSSDLFPVLALVALISLATAFGITRVGRIGSPA